MIRSMTAYGRGEYELADSVYIAELRSLNNRYRDLVIRIPKTLQVLEEDIRAMISSRIRRGRIEVSIQVDKKGKDMDYALELNRPLVHVHHPAVYNIGSFMHVVIIPERQFKCSRTACKYHYKRDYCQKHEELFFHGSPLFKMS